MRPLELISPQQSAAAQHSPHALLMNQYGHFCAFCERPLLAEAWVWDAATGKVVNESPVGPDGWGDFYLLDHNCFLAQAKHPEVDLSSLLLPGAPGAFRPFDEDSPFRYSLERLTRVLTDEDGRETGEPEVLDQVVISGSTEQARATIAHFELNTAYYRPEAQRLVIPKADYLSLADRRMEQRTLAWQRAEQVARVHVDAGGSGIAEIVIEQLRLLVGAMGFWSSCLTAVIGVMGHHDKERLWKVFCGPAGGDRKAMRLKAAKDSPKTPAVTGCGPHNTFPGTRDIF